ncbi:MAG: hypothetical protein CSA75_03030 [Sorangium cellulosum]|nr:MAG: hypothetical protein CSA75_03030 [Sorangium cellulosum]
MTRPSNLVCLAPDYDGDGEPDWPTVVFQPDGYPVVVPNLYDARTSLKPNTCDQNETPSCTPIQCSGNSYCVELQRYIEVIFFMRQAIDAYQLTDLSKKGVYD